MKPPSIEDMWQRYASTVGVPVGGVQWNETRMAFYAGVLDTMSTMQALGGESDDVGAAALDSMWREVQTLYRGAIDRAMVQWNKDKQP